MSRYSDRWRPRRDARTASPTDEADIPPARIRAEAARLFSEHGVAATSMRMLAESLGVTKPAIYHYFESKEQIHFEIHAEALEDAVGRLTEIHELEVPAREKVRRVIELMLSSIVERREVYTVLLREGTHLKPEHWHTIRDMGDHYRSLVESIVREGTETGELRAVDPAVVSLALLGMGNWAYTWLRPDGRLSTAELSAQFAEIVLAGVAAD